MNRAKTLVILAAAANIAQVLEDVAKLPKDSAIPINPFELNAAWLQAATVPDTQFELPAHLQL